MHIGARQIGPESPPYLIAEIGVNHDGSVERALELTRAAKDAGADAVKFQLFRADLLMSRAAKLAAYQKAAGESDPVEMLRRLELSIEQMEPVVHLAHEIGIHAIVTCFSVELVDEAERLPWDAYKTASPDIIHRPLLERLMATGRPLIVSTGASTLDEVKRAAEWLGPARERLAVLQCVSSYPTPKDREELGGISALREALAPLPIGYSDHTAGTITGANAVACGALVLEKHFTYDTEAAGPDHAASLDSRSFARYRSAVTMRWELARAGERTVDPPRHGWAAPFEKRVLDIEQDVRRVSRQSIVARGALPAGHGIRREDLTFKRPGTGIEPFRVDEIVGRRLARAVEGDMPIMADDVDRDVS
ncbi:MAG: N-acetylneuraminate synthase family protein [Phycisphaerales bacterium]|nr:N-acetylneuraminate synthase family protein [Phycisphaerales bacterium]